MTDPRGPPDDARMEPLLDASPLIGGSAGQTFHCFPRLPPELRVKIWSFALEEDRVVPLRWRGGDGGTVEPGLGDTPGRRPRRRLQRRDTAGCTTTARPPAALHVCHESRREALRRYRPSFGAASLPGRVLFDPERDLPFFGARDGYMASDGQFRTVLSLTPPAELRMIRRLALSEALLWVDTTSATAATAAPRVTARSRHDLPLDHAACSARELLGLVRARLPACRELVFVPHDGNPVGGDGIILAPGLTTTAAAISPIATAVPEPAAPRRLEMQLRSALDDVRAMFPTWDPPRISVMSLASPEPVSAPPSRGHGEDEVSAGAGGHKRRKTHHYACAGPVPHGRHLRSPRQQLPAACGYDGVSRIDMIHRSAVSKFQELREAAFLRMTQEAC